MLNNQLRFQGNAFFSMIGLVSGAVLNCVLDPLFFFNLNMGVSGAALATITLFYAVGNWSAWYNAMVYLQKRRDLYPLQLYLRRMLIEQTEQLGDMMDDAEAMRRAQQQQISTNQMRYTVIIVSSLPMLIAYPFFQQYFVKGVMIGSVKG